MGLSSAKIFCLCLIVLGILALLAGSSSPFWLTTEVLTIKYGFGLWFYCLQDTCSTYNWGTASWEDISVWFYVTHALAGLATLLAAIMLFVSLCSLCGEDKSTTVTGVLALICGLLGIAASAVFFAEPVKSIYVLGPSKGWSFFVFSAGSCVITLFSIILLILPGPQNNSVHPY